MQKIENQQKHKKLPIKISINHNFCVMFMIKINQKEAKA